MPIARSIDAIREIVKERLADADPAHDFCHVVRVERLALSIGGAEGANLDVVRLAAILHELFNYPKNHPESHKSGEICAQHAADLLSDHGYPTELIAHVGEAIRVHGFSAGLAPPTLEA